MVPKDLPTVAAPVRSAGPMNASVPSITSEFSDAVLRPDPRRDHWLDFRAAFPARIRDLAVVGFCELPEGNVVLGGEGCFGCGAPQSDRLHRNDRNRASRPLPCAPAKVFLLNPQPALSLGGRNRSSCPTSAIRDTRRDRLSWVESGHSATYPSWCTGAGVKPMPTPLKLTILIGKLSR